ncbi:MAG: hypothetical protein HAW67_06890 [Endozoicomonadaceae bacterium]|nr:hypothetical protein [Endozoicomonadaceae bacterium]
MKNLLTAFSTRLNKVRTKCYIFLLSIMPASAFAAEERGFTGVLKRLQDLFAVTGQTIVIAAFLGGLGCIGWMFWLMKQAGDSNNQQNKGIWAQIILFGIAGAGLMYVGIMATLAGETLLGDGAAIAPNVDDDFGL